MSDSSRKRPRDQLDEELLSEPRPHPPAMTLLTGASSTLLHQRATSPFERLTPPLVQLIAQFMPPRARMAHLPRLSRSFPSITSTAFQEDHITLTTSLMRSMSDSDRVRDLLSAVPAMSFDEEVEEEDQSDRVEGLSLFLYPSSTSASILRPPFLSGLKECTIRINTAARSPSTWMTFEALQHRRQTLARLIESLGLCPLLSSLSLTAEHEDDEEEEDDELEPADDSSIIDQLQAFPSLRTLTLRRLNCDEQSISLLLSLPLHHLDLTWVTVLPSERNTLYPCSLTLHSLFIPLWGSSTYLFQPYAQPTSPQGLRYLSVALHDDLVESSTAFLHSCPSLTALDVYRRYGVQWYVDSLFVETTATTPTRAGLVLPHLRHLHYSESDATPEVCLRVLQSLQWYGPQLLSLNLGLSITHDLPQVLRCCMEHCRQLTTLTLTLVVHEGEDGWAAEATDGEDEKKDGVSVNSQPAMAYPALPSLRYIQLSSTKVKTVEHLLIILTALPNLQHLRLICMYFLTVGVLPAIGAACRQLVSVRLCDVSEDAFLLTEADVAQGWSLPVSTPSSSFTTTCPFPHLNVLYVGSRKSHCLQHHPSVVSTLVSVLTPSPLTILRLSIHPEAEHYAIFSPLRHLAELDVRGLPLTFQSRVRRSRRQVQQWMASELSTTEWSVDEQHHYSNFVRMTGFDPPRWRVEHDGQVKWMDGRDAFFASQTSSCTIVSSSG